MSKVFSLYTREPGMAVFNDYQKLLFPYAYNILGSVDDAYDTIQEVITKHLSFSETKHIADEKNYLIRSVINTSITVKTRNKKMVSGVWLPEPVATDQADTSLNKTEIISYSMLVLLEHLGAKERAVFILAEAFDYAHEEIASAIDVTVENSRKLLSRAREKLKLLKHENKLATDRLPAKKDLSAYLQAIREGDTSALVELLGNDIAFTADSGGKVKIVRELTNGFDAVVDLLYYLNTTYQKEFRVELANFNHQTALLYYKEGKLINCQVFELDETGSKITHIYSVVDPYKLKHIGRS